MHVTARQATPQVRTSNFNVDVQFQLGGNGLGGAFLGVSGLDSQAHGAEPCDIDIPLFSLVTIPEIIQSSHVTLTNGVFSKGILLDEWFNHGIKKSTSPSTVVITLLDDAGKSAIIWTLKDAWPINIINEEPTSAGSRQILIESIELAHRGITIECA